MPVGGTFKFKGGGSLRPEKDLEKKERKKAKKLAKLMAMAEAGGDAGGAPAPPRLAARCCTRHAAQPHCPRHGLAAGAFTVGWFHLQGRCGAHARSFPARP